MTANKKPKVQVEFLPAKVERAPKSLVSLSLVRWQALVRQHYPAVEFTVEPPEDHPESGRTYGEPGTWTAHIGPDMQDDAIGCYSPGSNCDVLPPDSEEFLYYLAE